MFIYALNETDKVCEVTPAHRDQLCTTLLVFPLGLIDLVLGIVCVCCFCFKLWRIQHELAIPDVHGTSNKGNQAGRALMHMSKEQLKLS